MGACADRQGTSQIDPKRTLVGADGSGSPWHIASNCIWVVGFRFRGIVLKNSKIAGLQICRENMKQEAIADSYNLSRVTEVACKFSVGR